MVHGWKLCSVRMRKPWQQDPETARTVPTAGKQRAVDAGAQFILSSLYSLGPQPVDGATHTQAQSSHFSKLSLETPSHMCPLKLTVSIRHPDSLVCSMGELQGNFESGR